TCCQRAHGKLLGDDAVSSPPSILAALMLRSIEVSGPGGRTLTYRAVDHRCCPSAPEHRNLKDSCWWTGACRSGMASRLCACAMDTGWLSAMREWLASDWFDLYGEHRHWEAPRPKAARVPHAARPRGARGARG